MKLLACLMLLTISCVSKIWSQFSGAYWYGWGETAFQRVHVPEGAVGWSVVLHDTYRPRYISIAQGGNASEWDWHVAQWPIAERSTPSVRIARVPRPDMGYGAAEWRFVAYAAPPRAGEWYVGVGSGDWLFIAWDMSADGRIYRADGWGGNINLNTAYGWDGGRLFVAPITEISRVAGPR